MNPCRSRFNQEHVPPLVFFRFVIKNVRQRKHCIKLKKVARRSFEHLQNLRTLQILVVETIYEFNTFSNSVFDFYVRKFGNNFVIYPHNEKVSFQNFNQIFPVILRIFDLHCHGQTAVKVTFVMFGLVFIIIRKRKSLHRENTKPDLHRI